MPQVLTYTETKTRTEAIVDQFDMFLLYAGIGAAPRKKLLSGVEERWFDAIGVYLVNSAGRRILEAQISISWQLHTDLTVLSPTIRTDLPGWDHGAAPEIQVIGSRFGKKAKEMGRQPQYWVLFTSEIRQDAARYKQLCPRAGVSHGTGVPDWASNPKERSYTIDELSEVNVALREA
jgi:hypothetical protein